MHEPASTNTWRAVVRLVRLSPGLFLANVAVWTIVFHTSLLPGLVIQKVFDYLSSAAPLPGGLWFWIALMLAARLTHAGLHFPAAAIFPAHVFALNSVLRRNLLASILRRPGAMPMPAGPDGVPMSSGEAISRFRDDAEQLTLLVADLTVDITGLLVRFGVAFAIMLAINAPLAVAAVLPMVVLSGLVNLTRRRLATYRKASREASGAVVSFVGEIFDKVQAIKVANAEDRIGQYFDDLGERRRQADLKDTLFSGLLTTVLGNTDELSMALVLLLASRVMAAGRFTVGDFALFVIYLPIVTRTLDSGVEYLVEHRRAAVSFQRLETLLDLSPARGGEAYPSPHGKGARGLGLLLLQGRRFPLPLRGRGPGG